MDTIVIRSKVNDGGLLLWGACFCGAAFCNGSVTVCGFSCVWGLGLKSIVIDGGGVLCYDAHPSVANFSLAL